METVSGNINQAQLQQRANALQSQKKGVKKELKSIQAIGIPNLQSGIPILFSVMTLEMSLLCRGKKLFKENHTCPNTNT
ncbi:hypothetical protein B4140_0700 [Bacillus amyloliquefaciens]|nr:hypothetical protein AJ82_02530 [Bacillus velezensis TrigoCor1448]KYC87564.1 hypothetical protein B4140_0700 [Bacillus amyloliquefaciens]